MSQKTLLIFYLLFLSFQTFAQSPAEKRNRAVYNRIEYFFNTQATDSIYTLASDEFKKQTDKQSFINFISQLYPAGKITNAEPVTFANNIAGYNLSIGNQKSSLHLSVDSNYQFDYFKIDFQHIALRKADEIKSNVNNKSSLDTYIDSIAKSYLTNGHTKSLAIGVIQNNSINTFYYGQTDVANAASLPDGNTLYEIGSITKLFTATLLADLVEKQIISLDDSIAKFLPDSVSQNPYIQKITFKQLANHTSGLPSIPTNFDKVAKFNPNNPYASYTRKDLFQYLKSYQSEQEPGENYAYSNLAYGLLGELIAIISKKTYVQYLNETIITPLGLINSTGKANLKTQKLVKVYDVVGKEVPTWDFQAIASAGALKSTIHDLLRFAQYQFKLPETALENALYATRQFTYFLPPNTDIGLGWHMNMINDVIQYWHNGGTGGSSSFIGLVPDKKSALIILSNSAISVDEISGQILNKITSSK